MDWNTVLPPTVVGSVTLCFVALFDLGRCPQGFMNVPERMDMSMQIACAAYGNGRMNNPSLETTFA